jgi:hypothetical protein
MRRVCFIAGTALIGTAIEASVPQQIRDAAPVPATGSAAISGRVVTDERSSLPVRRARVTLNSSDGRLGFTATTDDGGRFRFAQLPAGRFALEALKPGYLTGRFGASRPGRPGTSISVTDGQQIAGLEIRIARGGVISGVVRDHRGQPMQGGSVQVLQYRHAPLTGDRTLIRVGSATADDRGMYRLFELPPGEYIVMARPMGPGIDEIVPISATAAQRVQQMIAGRPGAALSIAGTQEMPVPGPPVSYAPVFHPGSSDLSNAQVVRLGPGEERLDVDIAMDLVPTARLTVRITAADGTKPETITLEIARGGPDSDLLGQLATLAPSTRLRDAWTLILPGVPPGRFAIKAGTDRFLRLEPPARRVWGEAEVVVDGRNQEIAIALQPGVPVSGRVVFDGSSAAPGPASLQFFLTQGNGGAINSGPSGGDLDAEGRFGFPDVTPGRYSLMWVRRRPMANWTLASAMAGGRDVLDTRLEVRPGEPLDLVVTFTDRPTELTGVLQDGAGQAAPDHFIIVFTVDRSFWTPASRRVRMIRPGTDGAFSAAGLPPGEYYVGALLDVEPGEWYDPRFLDALTGASVRVALREGETTRQDLRVGR